MEDKKMDEMFQSLKDREITPSSNALKELHEALNEADKRERKKKPIAIGWVAAAVIVLAIGINFYFTNTSENHPINIVEAEVRAEPKETLLEEEEIVKIQGVEAKDMVEKLESKKSEIAESTPEKIKKSIPSTTTIVKNVSEEKEDEKVLKSNETIQLAENLDTVDATDLDEKLAELLKPIDDATLDSLIQQEQVALAIERMSDEEIMGLLRDAQTKLKAQGDTQLAYSAERLLEQAEVELETNRSLQSLLNKAIETGVAEVQSLFKR